MKSLLSMFLAVGYATALVGATPTFTGRGAATECCARQGIGHVVAKMQSGKPVKIGYLGGSITENDGWRRLSLEWLQAQYPGSSLSEIPAGVGGTGSELGAYRVGQDVLAHRPDLLFVEFAVNDAGLSPQDVWRNFDGIVRQTWRANPETDIVFVYTVSEAMLTDYAEGLCPTATSAMEQLADHYGIPSICFGPRVQADYVAGRIVMTIGEAYTAVPPETPRLDAEIAAELAKQGKMLFSKDGVHPTLQGSENYYMVSIATAWPSLAACAPADHAAKYNGGPFYSDVMEAAKIVPIKSSMLTGTWRRASENEPNAAVAKQFGTLPYFTETPGSKMSFAFRGSRCLIYDLFGPDCGQVFITVDGQRRAVPTARFDAYSGYYRTTALYVYGDMSGVVKLHTVEIELDSEQPSRAAVAESSTNPAKYNGTKWYPGRILIVGDLEPESSWFNARIEDYAIWPQDKNMAWGGVWDDAADELAFVGEKGKLTIESGTSGVSFQANQAKSLASGEVRSVTFESEIEFDEYKPEQLPAVDSEWKGGVLVVREESNELKYYGLVRDGSTNAWKPLAGPAVRADGSPAVFRMTFKPAGASLVVNYNIDGIDCTYAGKTDISVFGSQTVSDVVFGGSGTVHVLSAQADLPKNGLVLVVR